MVPGAVAPVILDIAEIEVGNAAVNIAAAYRDSLRRTEEAYRNPSITSGALQTVELFAV